MGIDYLQLGPLKLDFTGAAQKRKEKETTQDIVAQLMRDRYNADRASSTKVGNHDPDRVIEEAQARPSQFAGVPTTEISSLGGQNSNVINQLTADHTPTEYGSQDLRKGALDMAGKMSSAVNALQIEQVVGALDDLDKETAYMWSAVQPQLSSLITQPEFNQTISTIWNGTGTRTEKIKQTYDLVQSQQATRYITTTEQQNLDKQNDNLSKLYSKNPTIKTIIKGLPLEKSKTVDALLRSHAGADVRGQSYLGTLLGEDGIDTTTTKYGIYNPQVYGTKNTYTGSLQDRDGNLILLTSNGKELILASGRTLANTGVHYHPPEALMEVGDVDAPDKQPVVFDRISYGSVMGLVYKVRQGIFSQEEAIDIISSAVRDNVLTSSTMGNNNEDALYKATVSTDGGIQSIAEDIFNQGVYMYQDVMQSAYAPYTKDVAPNMSPDEFVALYNKEFGAIVSAWDAVGAVKLAEGNLLAREIIAVKGDYYSATTRRLVNALSTYGEDMDIAFADEFAQRFGITVEEAFERVMLNGDQSEIVNFVTSLATDFMGLDEKTITENPEFLQYVFGSDDKLYSDFQSYIAARNKIKADFRNKYPDIHSTIINNSRNYGQMVNSRYSFDSDEKAYKSWRDDALGQDNKKLLYNGTTNKTKALNDLISAIEAPRAEQPDESGLTLGGGAGENTYALQEGEEGSRAVTAGDITGIASSVQDSLPTLEQYNVDLDHYLNELLSDLNIPRRFKYDIITQIDFDYKSA